MKDCINTIEKIIKENFEKIDESSKNLGGTDMRSKLETIENLITKQFEFL